VLGPNLSSVGFRLQPLKQYYSDLLDGNNGPRVPEEANTLVILCYALHVTDQFGHHLVILKTTLQMLDNIQPNQDKSVKAPSVSHGDQAEMLTMVG